MMQRWKSHKIVEAEEIESIEGTEITLRDGETMHVDPIVFARGRPSPGDYLVRYEDGYLSWSPVKAFREGYTLADPEAA